MPDFFSLIFGLKTHAFLDVWSIEHILSGISIGKAVRDRNHKEIGKLIHAEEHSQSSRHFDIVGVLFIAYFWETIEHYLEEGLAGSAVAYWFQGVEFWGNRFIADPLMMLGGYLIAKRYPALVWPARILSLAWLAVHIFVFPHSMYLQELLGFK